MRRRIWWLVGLGCTLLLLGWPGKALAGSTSGPARRGGLVQAVPTATPAAQPKTEPTQPITHVVQTGETLFGIAQQYSTTVEAIATFNELDDPGLLSVGQELVIPEPGEAPEFQPEPDPAPVYHTYVALPGDTLDLVARRFEVTMTLVAELNGVANPANIATGQNLRVPGQQVGRLHPVAEDETALSLALRYETPLWEFLNANDLRSPGALLPGQRVVVPGQVTTGTLLSPFLALDVGPTPVLQGHTARVRVELVPDAELRGVFDDQALSFVATEGPHYALFGVHALDEPGLYGLALLATDANGDEVYLTRPVEVMAGDYGYEEIKLTEDRDALLDPEALATERARLAEVRGEVTPERYWDGLFLRPIDTEVTSNFGTRRLYQSPSYQFYSYHEGTDFDGVVGTPVHAPAPGVVVLAEPLYVRGNAVIIDHGWGVYSGYWHLSQIDVTVGQEVATGDQIALVGDTGLSTGAHLHWDFMINGVNVSALQWTEQAFP